MARRPRRGRNNPKKTDEGLLTPWDELTGADVPTRARRFLGKEPGEVSFEELSEIISPAEEKSALKDLFGSLTPQRRAQEAFVDEEEEISLSRGKSRGRGGRRSGGSPASRLRERGGVAGGLLDRLAALEEEVEEEEVGSLAFPVRAVLMSQYSTRGVRSAAKRRQLEEARTLLDLVPYRDLVEGNLQEKLRVRVAQERAGRRQKQITRAILREFAAASGASREDLGVEDGSFTDHYARKMGWTALEGFEVAALLDQLDLLRPHPKGSEQAVMVQRILDLYKVEGKSPEEIVAILQASAKSNPLRSGYSEDYYRWGSLP